MNQFNNKKIVITGHTGFKGSWLSYWLGKSGGQVYGISNDIPTKPSHFQMDAENVYEDIRLDIRDYEATNKQISQIKPDYLFHLAAQPLVLESYLDPLTTFQINVLGTTNILESLRSSNHKCIAIFITSDKAYDNVEWSYGYREIDELGGKDPYSSSKAACEIAISSWRDSFAKGNHS